MQQFKPRFNVKSPCQCNWIPKDNGGQIVQHNDHKWNSALHEVVWQSDDNTKSDNEIVKNLILDVSHIGNQLKRNKHLACRTELRPIASQQCRIIHLNLQQRLLLKYTPYLQIIRNHKKY